jgi:hypothetical protein
LSPAAVGSEVRLEESLPPVPEMTPVGGGVLELPEEPELDEPVPLEPVLEDPLEPVDPEPVLEEPVESVPLEELPVDEDPVPEEVSIASPEWS